MTPGKALQITQALAFAQDPEHRHKQQLPGWDADISPHLDIRHRLEADQIEIGSGRNALERREGTIPTTSIHARSHGQNACDTL